MDSEFCFENVIYPPFSHDLTDCSAVPVPDCEEQCGLVGGSVTDTNGDGCNNGCRCNTPPGIAYVTIYPIRNTCRFTLCAINPCSSQRMKLIQTFVQRKVRKDGNIQDLNSMDQFSTWLTLLISAEWTSWSISIFILYVQLNQTQIVNIYFCRGVCTTG